MNFNSSYLTFVPKLLTLHHSTLYCPIYSNSYLSYFHLSKWLTSTCAIIFLIFAYSNLTHFYLFYFSKYLTLSWPNYHAFYKATIFFIFRINAKRWKHSTVYKFLLPIIYRSRLCLCTVFACELVMMMLPFITNDISLTTLSLSSIHDEF